MLPGLISMEESELSPRIGPRRRQRASGQRVCGCVHVRTGTIMLGMWHLVMNVLALSALAMVIFHPEMLQHVQLERAPTANLSAEGAGSEAVLPPRVMPKYGPTYSVLGGQVWNVDDLNIGIMITFCTFIITLLMVVGAIKGQPSYLMPFFCLQVFDFCISSLTMISYFSFMPDLHVMLVRSSSLPFRDQLLRLDQRWLSLILMVAFLVAMVIKAYLIAMVWACYRYLLMRQAGGGGGGGGGAPAEPDPAASLPDYEVALSDPRFSKVDLANYPAPPPSYDAATSEAGARAK
ncbi:lysosomal-associated transmembrane protein 4A-like [Pollicipes pollicipes]|uniref:lysosomal-associated transmembrane protein 4A-like n=1 Tax=Pollicipes pollicipes TaxID=41117 RepID=UPI0018850C3B|nr:lysosomal-associated transmembrane protein 4A-like [Pollicipes pollicipes]XP_037090403.1 lysosomal-associated transmembrane protein 4A-like [Pollicipes pollicipes]XP_037090404.1 lysosomal-associated transmembrane protein 4A-like [Pollicipes pollicipes]